MASPGARWPSHFDPRLERLVMSCLASTDVARAGIHSSKPDDRVGRHAPGAERPLGRVRVAEDRAIFCKSGRDASGAFPDCMAGELAHRWEIRPGFVDEQTIL